MILQALLALAERDGIGDPDFETVGLRWLLPITGENSFGPPIPVSDDPDAEKPKPKAVRRPFTSPNEMNQGKTANFLCDTLERAVLFLGPDSSAARAAQHAHFKSLLSAASQSCPSEHASLEAVLRTLEDPEQMKRLHARLEAAKARPSDIAAFTVDGAGLLDRPALQQYWRDRRAASQAQAGLPSRVCFATGRVSPVLKTHEKIKGIPGANPVGANLVSFDKEAFCSFGLEQALNAAVSAAAEPKIRAALSTLVEKSRRQRLVLGDAVVVHWTRLPMELDPLDLLASADPEGVRALLESIRRGSPPQGNDANAYYAATLSGNGGRVVVRDWLETTVPRIERAVGAWFGDLEIATFSPPWRRREFGLPQILHSLDNPVLDKPFAAWPHGAAENLLRAALAGAAPSRALLAAALRREAVAQGRSDAAQPPTARLALIKLCLLRSPNRKEHHTVTASLEPESKDPAYLCGQLFAVLGRLQLLALGKVGAGITDRTYGGVSVRPATTLGPIFTKAPAYLKKANDRYPGSGTNKQKEIEALCVRLEARGGLPATLDLEEQGRFALGYYCQLAAYRARREEADLEAQAREIQENE